MSEVMQSPVVGTSKDDTLKGGAIDELFLARQGADVVQAAAGNDRAFGGRGNDTLFGQAGNDVMYGGGSGPSLAELDRLVIDQDHQGSVAFLGETAGYANSLGWYKVVDGEIVDVQVLWSNASLKGSGGSLSAGDSKTLDLRAGDQIGFFIVSNGAALNDFSKFTDGRYEFRDADGKPATLDTANPKLWFVGGDGKAVQVKGDGYHTAAYGETLPLNNDGILHTVGLVDASKGIVRIGFEDLKGGGDRDFDDAVFSVDIGTANVKVLSAHGTTGADAGDGRPAGSGPAKPYVEGTENDTLYGGEGSDKLYGRAGHDKLFGESGSDELDGGSGDDVLDGGSGDDVLRGGAGNDTLAGGAGKDTLSGGSGEDRLDGGDGDDTLDGGSGDDHLQGGTGADKLAGGAGRDTLLGGTGDDRLDGGADDDSLDGGTGDDVLMGGSGNDKLAGGSGRDSLDGGAGDDHLDGGDGNDTLAGGAGGDVLIGGSGTDRLMGGRGDDVLIGGQGKDTLSGGEGSDTFVFRPADGGSGVDVITDFEIGADHIDVSAFGLVNGVEDVSFAMTAGGLDILLDTHAGAPLCVATVKGPQEMLARMGHDSFIV
ncbi:DUF4114 domain-containing protein [Rhodoplanes sp. TEM]|uniref:DUF4114 domain-containing protein n=1 Tax=Rhodoplanes tepidamans TaxID=200616 RepID=A0ABT5JI89_RHOTP|nr:MULTISPECIES: DUF4114 domain-containing protein [Rhodoplanes]MDC7789436.1 DUF4114 domain-containing protein [Rhodoplanes tepidamans]MDC7985427.1 DUF4114 domain-containing protein [Rhodoplanes sp. TEM]MDQ0353609.1 Ca2+-binding RTX toxin-like protein [Rhodoplanes tepidamans]